MNKTKQVVLWILGIVALTLVVGVLNYFVDMRYANIAPMQVESDSAYYALKTQRSIHTIINTISYLGYAYIVYNIIRVVLSKPSEK